MKSCSRGMQTVLQGCECDFASSVVLPAAQGTKVTFTVQGHRTGRQNWNATNVVDTLYGRRFPHWLEPDNDRGCAGLQPTTGNDKNN